MSSLLSESCVAEHKQKRAGRVKYPTERYQLDVTRLSQGGAIVHDSLGNNGFGSP